MSDRTFFLYIFGLICFITATAFGGHYLFAADPTGTNTRPFGSFAALTFATLPPAVTGTEAYISDGLAASCADTTCTTFGTNVTGGGGALKLLVWYNGANWTLVGK